MGTVSESTWASSVAPDAPTSGPLDQERFASLQSYVSEVSSEWCFHLVDCDTLALFLPFDQSTWHLSKEAFVSLLEYCEDNLPVKRILLCLDKACVEKTVVACFKYVGFTPLHPDYYPYNVDPQRVFAMVYTV